MRFEILGQDFRHVYFSLYDILKSMLKLVFSFSYPLLFAYCEYFRRQILEKVVDITLLSLERNINSISKVENIEICATFNLLYCKFFSLYTVSIGRDMWIGEGSCFLMALFMFSVATVFTQSTH